MPTVYAHYRFGVALLPTIPADARRTIQRFRSLYDVGLHGPDIFYYHTNVINTKTSFLGIKFHEQTGREFFQRVCRMARLEKSEASQAYLYGLLCHYVLDSVCHSFLGEQTLEASHAEVETEFDRFLLELDGKVPPHCQDFSPHLRLTPGECETVAKFYPPAGSAEVRNALRSMAATVKFLASPEGHRRTLMEKSMKLLAPELAGMVMTAEPNARCAHLDRELLGCYEKAVEVFPEMLSQLQAHMTYNGQLGQEFDKVFG